MTTPFLQSDLDLHKHKNNYAMPGGLTLNSTDTHFEASTTDIFRKHCGKRRNCS